MDQRGNSRRKLGGTTMEGMKRSKETEKPPRSLVCQSRRKMPGNSMCSDESKKISKEKPIQNTEKNGTDISHHKIWYPVKEK